jgi:hypothetical protein
MTKKKIDSNHNDSVLKQELAELDRVMMGKEADRKVLAVSITIRIGKAIVAKEAHQKDIYEQVLGNYARQAGFKVRGDYPSEGTVGQIRWVAESTAVLSGDAATLDVFECGTAMRNIAAHNVELGNSTDSPAVQWAGYLKEADDEGVTLNGFWDGLLALRVDLAAKAKVHRAAVKAAALKTAELDAVGHMRLAAEHIAKCNNLAINGAVLSADDLKEMSGYGATILADLTSTSTTFGL